MTHDMWQVVNIVYKFKVNSSIGLGFMMEEKDDWLNTVLSGVWQCVKGNCKPPPKAESLVRSWKLAGIAD